MNDELHPPYRALGTLRLVLALVVVMGGHSAWLAPDNVFARFLAESRAGSVAVLAFFVISGFVITEAASTFYNNRSTPFAVNRCLKIVPAYLGALVLAIAVHAAISASGNMLQALEPEGYSTLPDMWTVGNILFNSFAIVPMLFHDNAAALLSEDLYVFVRFIWAINVEAMFYVVVWLGIIGRGRRLSNWLLAHTFKSTLIFAVVWLLSGLNFVPWSIKYYFAYAPYFLLGALLWKSHQRANAPLIGAILLALGLVAYHITQASSFQEAKVSLLVGMLLVYGSIFTVWLLTRTNVSGILHRIDKKSGDLSYAVYLNQFTVLVLFSGYVEARGTFAYLSATACVIVVAVVMQYLVERPLVVVRARFRGASFVKQTRQT